VAHVVVGLGNPGPEYESTRHNVGHRVVEHLARRFHARWRREGRAQVARGEWAGESVALVKPGTYMNMSGPAVAAALTALGASPEELILVYDDIDLPLGTVRVKMKGSHGGHNGVRSVIATLATSEIRRVKVGIGRPDHKDAVVDWVLAGFEREELPVVESVVEEAADRVMTLMETARPLPG
jgi:peptidyl-tRNA hydrolase, PTH1 family